MTDATDRRIDPAAAWGVYVTVIDVDHGGGTDSYTVERLGADPALLVTGDVYRQGRREKVRRLLGRDDTPLEEWERLALELSEAGAGRWCRIVQRGRPGGRWYALAVVPAEDAGSEVVAVARALALAGADRRSEGR